MDLRGEVAGWTANSFSQTRSADEVPQLLREVADSIEQLSPVEVLDLVGTSSVNDDGSEEYTVTVYVNLDVESESESESG
jgi:hypothetical protein